MTTKICSSCKKEKDVLDFYSKGKENRVNSMCKKCFNAYCINRWISKKKWAIEYKGNKCSVCSTVDSYVIYDFHHLDPSKKELVWDKMRLVSRDKLIRELDKCILVCSNCHRKLHQ